MCLIAFAWDNHPKYKLILAANRDEFYERPTAPAGFWEDKPQIFGGRDLKASGTWMGFSTEGKFGALTNYRDLKNIKPDAKSRGDIVTGFLDNHDNPENFVKQLHEQPEAHNGFNLLTCDFKTMIHYSNYERKLNIVKPGIHGLSNALMDTSWPKVDLLKTNFNKVIADDFSHEDLFSLLTPTGTFEDEVLPNTGISRELEKSLSAICIRTEKYGTVGSTVLTVDRFGKVEFTEKTHGVGDREENTVNFEFEIKV